MEGPLIKNLDYHLEGSSVIQISAWKTYHDRVHLLQFNGITQRCDRVTTFTETKVLRPSGLSEIPSIFLGPDPEWRHKM